MKWVLYGGIGAAAVILVSYLALVLWARRAPRPDTLGLTADGKLAPLPASPNAVSTQADDPDRRMDPLVYHGDRDTTRAALLDLLRSIPRVTIVTENDDYIHAEFRTKLIGYIDDVGFVFDDEARIVHYRSASRLGHSDLGANRKRMARVQDTWNQP